MFIKDEYTNDTHGEDRHMTAEMEAEAAEFGGECEDPEEEQDKRVNTMLARAAFTVIVGAFVLSGGYLVATTAGAAHKANNFHLQTVGRGE